MLATASKRQQDLGREQRPVVLLRVRLDDEMIVKGVVMQKGIDVAVYT